MAGWLVSSVLTISRSVARIGQSLPSSSTSTDPRNDIEEDLRKLEKTLERIQVVLHDAEERKIRDAYVKLWLRELRGVAYDAEDVLEDYRYEVLRSEAEARAAAAAAKATRKRKLLEEREEDQHQQVFDLVSTSSSSLSTVLIPDGMGEKIREIRMRFDEIAKERDALHLRPGDGERRFEPPAYPPPSGSLVDDKGVFGREDDKKKVIELLFSDERCCFSVVPIVGMGGLGKTTLAQLIYNDPNVSKHFNLRGWVSVSVDFDVPRIMRAIIESFSNKSCNLTELSSLQDTLRKQVEGKSVMVVLDDVWNEKRSLWESLQFALIGGKWVRVIATTRNDSVARIMHTVTPYNLDGLHEDQCRLLFQRHAFGAENPESHEKQQLVEIGEKIVKKCAGLPLAVKALACLLGGETDVERWEEVMKSDMWELDQGEDEILPALRLSYHRLPTYLKPCFVYCSMFPKSHEFKEDELIRQWMAQGYIQLRGSRSPEDAGSDYFDQLLRRSFFQKYPSYASKGKESFVIHDLMVDLALSISWEDLRGPLTWREARHLCMENGERPQEMVESLSSCHDYKPTALRTFCVWPYKFFSNRSLGPLMKLLNLKYLRALSWVRIEWLPDSIGSSMKHLRYLGLDCQDINVLPGWILQLYSLQTLDLMINNYKVSLEGIGSLANLRYFRLFCFNPEIKKLPESFCRLHNLWTLDVSSFYEIGLPSGLGDLINLRHLFLPVRDIGTHENIGKLTNLRSLSQFNVTRCTGIGELKGMIELGGKLIIHGLEKVSSPAEARQANLNGKHRIEKLQLGWGSMGGDKELEADVLESLQPHTNLQELRINYYGGFRVPIWMADPSFSHLTKLILSHNINIVFLPPLGRLPALESLSLYQLKGVRCIGHDFSCDTADSSKVGFPSLKRLEFQYMDAWEEWDGVQDGDFPHLESLKIEYCPKLRRLPNIPLLQSRSLSIYKCEHLGSISLQQNSGRPPRLQKLSIISCPRLTSVMSLHNVDSLQELNISECRALPYIPGDLPSKVRVLLGSSGNLMTHQMKAYQPALNPWNWKLLIGQRITWRTFSESSAQNTSHTPLCGSRWLEEDR